MKSAFKRLAAIAAIPFVLAAGAPMPSQTHISPGSLISAPNRFGGGGSGSRKHPSHFARKLKQRRKANKAAGKARQIERRNRK